MENTRHGKWHADRCRAIVGLGWAMLLCAGAAHGETPAGSIGYENEAACLDGSGEQCIGAGEYFSRQSHRNTLDRLPKARAREEGKLSIGLALAGGGTRASQFSIGVLKGLHESGLLPDVDFLSTVSGGGYAGYWYMAQRIGGATPDDMFRDCIPKKYGETAKSLGHPLMECTAADVVSGANCLCPVAPEGIRDDGASEGNHSSVVHDEAGRRFLDPFRFQNSLRTHTDLFAPSFSDANTRSDHRLLPAVASPLVMQLAVATTVDVIGDVLFDWNVNSSPSRALYKDGIHRVYGLPPVDCAGELSAAQPWALNAAKQRCLMSRPLLDELPANSDASRRKGEQDLDPLSFAGLAEHWQGNGLPYWIINATTPVLNCPSADGRSGCVVREVFGKGGYPPHKAAFEFTADYWGAGEFGYWKVDAGHTPFGRNIEDVLGAVASSAAFFDPRQRSFMLGGVANAALQLTGFRWGYYIANPHVSNAQRKLHLAIPFPFYVFHRWRETKDAVDVHLIDGGQSDNLGAYGLIRRRVPNIILSDHAGEGQSGNMEDICKLRNSLLLDEFEAWNKGRKWYVHFDDLADLDKVCDGKVDLAEEPPTAPQTAQGFRYNLHAWKHPVLRGCAVELTRKQADEHAAKLNSSLPCAERKGWPDKDDGTLRFLNLFLIKPALDLAAFESLPDPQRFTGTPLAAAELRGEIELRGFLGSNASVQEGSGVLLFPNHTTVNLTLDSSPWLFGAYRELGARAARTLRVRDGELVVDGDVRPPPMQPKADYLIDREACDLTQKLVESLGGKQRNCLSP